ncbi:MAG: hypothetical protein AAF963_02385 [Bacteroidota bacterium]
MYIPFEQLSDEARIWIYQANRSLTQEEQASMLQKALSFLTQWVSHGNPLQSSAALLYDQFLILAVEESFQGATGCAVDASIQFIRSLEQEFKLVLLDRTQIAFRQGDSNVLVPLEQLQAQIQQGVITADTLTFDNSITRKVALDEQWLVRAQDAWLSKYFELQPAVPGE